MPVDGGEPVQVTREGGFQPIEGRDGRDLYYAPSEERVTAVMKASTAGGQPIKVFEDVPIGQFDVLDRGIYFVAHTSQESQLRFFDFTTKTTATVARGLGEVVALLTASADGRRVFYSRVDSRGRDLMLVDKFK